MRGSPHSPALAGPNFNSLLEEGPHASGQLGTGRIADGGSIHTVGIRLLVAGAHDHTLAAVDLALPEVFGGDSAADGEVADRIALEGAVRHPAVEGDAALAIGVDRWRSASGGPSLSARAAGAAGAATASCGRGGRGGSAATACSPIIGFVIAATSGSESQGDGREDGDERETIVHAEPVRHDPRARKGIVGRP